MGRMWASGFEGSLMTSGFVAPLHSGLWARDAPRRSTGGSGGRCHRRGRPTTKWKVKADELENENIKKIPLEGPEAIVEGTKPDGSVLQSLASSSLASSSSSLSSLSAASSSNGSISDVGTTKIGGSLNKKSLISRLKRLMHPGLWRERVKVLVMCFIAFVVTNMDRVNVSVVMLPLAKYHNWQPVTVGVIQSAFFWGYLLTQIPGGYFADKYGGKMVFTFGMLTWSIMTLSFPYVADRSVPLLIVSRILLGIGEGVILPAMNQIVSRWIRVNERSRSLGFIYSGIYLGSILGLSISPNLMRSIGWQFIFLVFGLVGLLWTILWLLSVGATPSTCKGISKNEARYIRAGMTPQKTEANALRDGIPWRLLFTSRPFWALMISHFCVTWGYFVLLTWLPTYFNTLFGFDMASSSFLSIVPWASMFINANVSGLLADFAVSRGVPTAVVRKGMQSIGFLGPAACLLTLTTISNPALCVVLLAMATGLGSFCQAGVYSNHQDIGPEIAGVLLGITNTAAAIPGIVGVLLTGLILQTNPFAWNLVFYITIAFYLLGAIVFNSFATTDRVF